MKVWNTAPLMWLAVLLPLLPRACGQLPVNCQWGPYGDWSECDGCTKTQTRSRPIQVFAQFGGTPCSEESIERRSCISIRGCPLEAGCGGRFRCQSGQCISQTLVCNGDQDCEEDGLDEQHCDESGRAVCDQHKPPPNAELTGKGFDVLTGKLRGDVINTKSFGGQCRVVFSGDHRTLYRLPQSLLSYTFQVNVDNDFGDEFYNSSWSYMKHSDNRDHFKGGHRYQTFHRELTNSKAHRLMIIKNEVEVAQFLNAQPQTLPLSEEFWKALSYLPTVYEHEAYHILLEKFGTHFLSEGSLGGQYQALLQFDSESMSEMSTTDTDYHKCVTTVKRRLFRKKTTTRCEKLIENLKQTNGFSRSKIPVKTHVVGGHPAFVAGLGVLDLDDPEANLNMYSKWAGSVKDFPGISKLKIRPLYELVKEVPCAAVKKLHLKRAMETYLDRLDPCQCQPCQNNGQPLLEGTGCACACRPDTSGYACELGAVLGEQPGVINGGWSCWTSWGSCTGGQRSRARTCNNPVPMMGGRHCIGQPTDHRPCEDPDLEHLRMIEPHCFDPSVTPPKSCKAPPALRNGFVLDPKDVYLVGSKVSYSCMAGYYITGDQMAECTEQQDWKAKPMECKSIVCLAPRLQPDVTGMPWKPTYEIGETMSLACPPGKRLDGSPEITCDSSLNWFPSQKDTACYTPSANLPNLPAQQEVKCQSWEKHVVDHCVCKMPYECGSSLEVCATNQDRGRTDRLTVCKIGALECLGRRYTLAEDSACDWPGRQATPCSACQLWEKCEEHGATCLCRQPGECSEHGAHVCVQQSDDKVTMTECEVGLRRCRGEPISVISIRPCQP